MGPCWLLLFSLAVAVLLAWRLPTPRFYLKQFLFGATILFASALGAVYILFRPVSTENHYVIFLFLQRLASWTRIRFRVENEELLDTEEPFILIANHQSALDVLTMTKIWPKNCVVLLKNSLQYVPFFNLCAWKSGAIFIDRFHKDKAHQSMESARKGIVEERKKVFIYPEGTRNNKPELLPFKKGAFLIAKEVPIVPVVFSPYSPFYNYDTKEWLSEGVVTIRVLPKVSPEGKDVEQLSKECRDVMQKAFTELGGARP